MIKPGYDVALSYATEDQKYVTQVARHLKRWKVSLFFDIYDEASLWGKNLYDHLSDVYKNKASFTVMFISQYYARKNWTNHERKSAQSRAFELGLDSILPARFDNSEIPGIPSTTRYVDLRKTTPSKLALLIKQRVSEFKKNGKIREDFDIGLSTIFNLSIFKFIETRNEIKSLRIKFKNMAELKKIISIGLSADKFKLLTYKMGFTPRQASALIGVSLKALSRFASLKATKLSPLQSEIIIRIAVIYDAIEFEFENENIVNRWLNSSNIKIGFETPLEFIEKGLEYEKLLKVLADDAPKIRIAIGNIKGKI